MYNSDTIIAAATPRGTAALAILRITGTEAHQLTAALFSNGEKLLAAKPFTMKLYTVTDGADRVIDEVTALKFNGPRSFTGENMVEITCHGGQIIVEQIIARAIELGMRYAGRGEFSRRAFLGGKVDLKKAESINRLIHAESVAAHRNAISHYFGRERAFFDDIRSEIQQLLVALETEIEFSETDDIGAEELFSGKISELLERIIDQFKSELRKRERLKEVDKGVTVSLVGRANAGKSSLLNMLLGYDRAIINSRAGTTRDIIAETSVVGGVKVRFVDTAGLNDTDDEIELEGIRRTRAAIDESAMLLWVMAADEPVPVDDLTTVAEHGELLVLINKSDLTIGSEAAAFCEERGIAHLPISAVSGAGEEALLSRLEQIIEARFGDSDYETVIGSEREEGLIRKMLMEAEEIDLNLPMELLSESFRSLLRYLDDIYGTASPDELLNQVFNDFCIGK